MFGEDDGMLVQQILDQLSKRAEYGGRKSQPGSAVEMGRFIVEHCAGSYDRRPESARQSAPDAAPSDNQKKPWVEEELSISQIYSNYMSEIVHFIPSSKLWVWNKFVINETLGEG